MELWDLYSENREIIGEHIRGNKLPEKGFHLVVHVWIKNSKGEYLISQRAKNRLTFPLMYECVGGSVLKGENSLEGAIREVQEEVGINLNPNNGKIIETKIRKIIENKQFNDILDIWLFDYDGEIDLSKATTNEVKKVQWMTKEEIKKLFDEGKFIKTLRYFFKENYF